MFFSIPVLWKVNKQSTIITLLTKLEFIVFLLVIKEFIIINRLFYKI